MTTPDAWLIRRIGYLAVSLLVLVFTVIGGQTPEQADLWTNEATALVDQAIPLISSAALVLAAMKANKQSDGDSGGKNAVSE